MEAGRILAFARRCLLDIALACGSPGAPMKYVMAFGGKAGPMVLGEDASSVSLSKECREAALAFMSGVAIGWDKIDLALWLTGPYARATRHAKRGERVADVGGGEAIDDDTIEDLVRRVRGQLIAALESAALDDGSLDFAEEAVSRGLVRRATSVEGEQVWVPVDAARLRLKDRLASLFAADFLNAPTDYGALFVCNRCESVTFDANARRFGLCAAHRISGVVPREDTGITVTVEDRRDGTRRRL